ncbi:ammonia monooxygenase [Rhodanobacter denitrificans]|nr:ammonia monooxygenase [Rhodanobacter denitrificans]
MSKVKQFGSGSLHFDCPGCGEPHVVNVSGGHPGWTFNGDFERPTLSPSVLVRTGHYCNNPPVPGNCACDFQQRFPDQDPWDWPCSICHSYVRDGRIEFLPDSTHALAGKTVELPDIAA